jgi:N-acetylglutamate synthase-like GNAT family acetyltransferase
MESTLPKLKIKKANPKDWGEILEIMEETGRTVFFNGTEDYKKFYVVRNSDNEKMLSAFVIESESDIAILKFFGVRKNIQGKGIGKFIANKIPEIVKEFEIKKLYASTWEALEFWRKTIFKEIKISEIKDRFFLVYLGELEKRFPYEYNNLLKNYFVEIK